MRPYSHPLSPIPVNGDRYALSADFVNGLAFLRPLVKPRGKDFEKQVGLLAGKLFVLTTSLVIEYDAGSLELPDFWFSPDVIRTLEAFGAPPTEVFVHRTDLCFRWQDEQEFFVRLHNLIPGSTHRQMVDEAFTHYQPFTQGVEVTNTTRRDLRRMHGDKKLAADLFINGQSAVSRMSSNGKTWTHESTAPFLNNATRIMRFDRHAFLGMIRIADEIDFSISPVCFRHAHGKGLLIERTATLDTPEMGQFDG
ncbi:hypothetical protein PEL8287_03706 [Roseovarius litorisediminis]|uniref:Uncharacterized protein n=2 Tax=Roseovarius litorisediminis TaxID=1312363 RepID=A0A1Y5TP97_9RHOB|nr:hypothetical protein PEL8287_03706 [Roseovarius litorisediminis]